MTVETLGVIGLIIVLLVLSLQIKQAQPPRPKKKFAKTLWHSEPIEPEHRHPKAISPLADDVDREFFSDFADFASVVNWELADHNFPSPWRLQELPDTELKVAHSDQPSFGRRYEIFHNQVRVGILELSAGYRYTAEKPNLITRIDLKFIRLFSLEAIGSLLGVIIKHVCSDDTNSQERAQATRAVESAVMRVLWENQRIHQHTRDRHWGEIRVDIRGTASGWYFRRREALYKQQAP